MTHNGVMVTSARRTAMYARTGKRTGRMAMAEKEYIEREKAIDALTERNLVVHMDSVNDGLVASCHRSAQRIIANLPAADVRPVVRGKWKLSDDLCWHTCSECGADIDVSVGLLCYVDNEEVCTHNFCPNCGADMREKS
jgi:hypothetical protein